MTRRRTPSTPLASGDGWRLEREAEGVTVLHAWQVFEWKELAIPEALASLIVEAAKWQERAERARRQLRVMRMSADESRWGWIDLALSDDPPAKEGEP